MDHALFDTLTRRFTDQVTRRHSLGLLGALGVAGATLNEDAAAKKKKKKSKKKNKNKSPTCSDGVKNGSETGVDCGGSCQPCANGQTCASGNDCASAICTSGVCTACTGACPANCLFCISLAGGGTQCAGNSGNWGCLAGATCSSAADCDQDFPFCVTSYTERSTNETRQGCDVPVGSGICFRLDPCA